MRAAESDITAFRDWLARAPTWLALFVLGLSAYLLTMPADLRNNADTTYRLDVTKSLLHGHIWIQCGPPSPNDSRVVLGRHGCWYAIYGPGQSALMAPLYVIGKGVSRLTATPEDFATAVFTRALDPILGALVLVFFYLLAVAVGYQRRTAIVLAIILAFASTLWPDVQSGQEQTQVTLALAVAVYAALRARNSSTLRQGRRWLLLSGGAAGVGLFTRYDFVIYAVVLLGFVMWWFRRGFNTEAQRRGQAPSDPDRRKRAYSDPRRPWLLAGACFLLGLVPFGVADGLWNTVRFGAPWRLGESASAQLGLPIWQGVPNLLLSPAKGIVWYLPLLWLLPLAIRPFWRRSPDQGWLIAVLFASAVLFYANIVYWHGDPAWGPRYLFPVVPLLILPLGELIESFASLRFSVRGLIVGVIGLSLALQLSAVLADPWRFWYHLIQQRENAGQLFKWGPKNYNYYWSSHPGFDPELYQFAAVKDVVAIGLGRRQALMPERSRSPDAPSRRRCRSITPARTRAYDACQLPGVSFRPLNTISPIWLNDRYQWYSPAPVPLSTASRAAIMALLLALAGLGGGVLHVQFWGRRIED